ncbi:FtsX-like permease family protein [Sulfurirhabdus autotrophica]|uniref:FtsX-like permease family protein n=1 Tax=Sulfurirhabdus autotrophica TaxID=1706046 RepID=UPI0014053337|nr:ABC transporter permease [Sulfurirhabdus autotrophica]
MARKILLHDKLRFLTTISGVAFAVTLVLVQAGLFVGLLDNATITIRKMNADIWVSSKNTPNIDFASPFSDSLVQRVRSIPGIQRADNLLVGFMQISLPSGAREGIMVYAMDDLARWNLPWRIIHGDVADLRRGHYFFLDESATKRFGKFKVGDYREILDQRLKIIGLTQEARSFTTTPIAFMDFQLAQFLMYQYFGGRTAYIVAKLAPGADETKVIAEMRRRLPYNDVYTKDGWATQSRDYWINSTGIGLNMYLTVFLGCLVGVVVVAQTLYTMTMEHVKEFGTVKAIGGTNADIYLILAKQATIAAVTGFTLGALLSYALRPLVSKLDLKLIIYPELVVWVFFGTLILCLAAAMLSFRKVASIDPALVFRT